MATKRKVRALSAWNVFQQEQMQQSSQSLTPDEYRVFVKEVSQKWRQLSAEERQPYQIEAEHQQQLRNKLAETPLAPKADSASVGNSDINQSQKDRQDLEDKVGQRACKKLSARRLMLNKQAEQDHSLWTSSTQYGDSYSTNLLATSFSTAIYQLCAILIHVIPCAWFDLVLVGCIS